MEMQTKKAGIFLRVSTKQQVSRNNDNEVDLPVQREKCLEYISRHPDWEFVKEYMEVGSGYNQSADDRDKLMEVQEDIENGVINVLVVFMFDRIGRVEEESPFVLQNFVKLGAEVYSYNEGQRTFDTHIDSLLNYITFWQASGESKKTSMRVTEAMSFMAQQGQYIGGRCPYGYRAVEIGGYTKKGLPQRTFVIDEEEAENVRLMYQLAVTRNYGCHRIARYLNERGIATRGGKQWGHATIANILRNPMYKGLKAYRRTKGKSRTSGQKRRPPEEWILPETPNPAWAIVTEELWEQVQQIKDDIVKQQKKQQEFNESIPGRTLGRSKLLFIGYIYCGSCGCKMNTGYSPYRWRTADGVMHRKDNPVYRCTGYSSGKVGCTGKSSYKPALLEGVVLEEVKDYMNRLATVDLSAEIHRIQRANTAAEEKAVKRLSNELQKLCKEKDALEQEVIKVITGESEFDKGMLNRLITEKEEQIKETSQQLSNAEYQLKRKQLAGADLAELQTTIPNWNDVFEAASHDEKKVMLSKIIERITVFSIDDEEQEETGAVKFYPEIKFAIHVEQFLKNANLQPVPTDGDSSEKIGV